MTGPLLLHLVHSQNSNTNFAIDMPVQSLKITESVINCNAANADELLAVPNNEKLFAFTMIILVILCSPGRKQYSTFDRVVETIAMDRATYLV